MKGYNIDTYIHSYTKYILDLKRLWRCDVNVRNIMKIQIKSSVNSHGHDEYCMHGADHRR